MLKSVTRWLIKWEIAWLFILTPFLFFPSPRRSLTLLALPLLWLIRWIAYRRFIARTPLDWPLLLMLLMVGVSLWATFDPLFSLPKVTGVLLGIAFYYAYVEYSQQQKRIWLPLSIFIAITSAVAGVSLVGTTWASKFPLFAPITARLPQIIRDIPGNPSTGFNPNSVAGALLFAFPLLLVMVWPFGKGVLQEIRGWRRTLIYVMLLSAFVIVGGPLILTQSRGGYLGLLAGLAALMVLPRRSLMILSLVIGSFLLSLLFYVGVEPLENYFSGGSAVSLESGINSLQGRLEIWSRAIYGLQDFPFTGMGMGTFRKVVPILYPLFTISPSADIGHAHNHLLAAGLDLGIPGLLAYLALWFGSMTMCWQVCYHSSNPIYRRLTLGLVSGMLAHFVWGIFDANVLGSKAGFLFWLALGTIASLHSLAYKKQLIKTIESFNLRLETYD